MGDIIALELLEMFQQLLQGDFVKLMDFDVFIELFDLHTCAG
jgi:hypothetical protein